MESDQPPSEASDDPKQSSTTTTPEEPQQTTTHTPRSYECNFCKRGFTNAQALGGHMNIHRKDKGKFKHSSSTTLPNAVVESPSLTRPRLSATTTTNPFSISHQGNWFPNPQQDEKKPLPLFGPNDVSEVPRNIHQPGNSPSPDREVDLELRLGHVEQPSESSSENKSTTTRKFF
ncbi:unnamed protein product [Lactuca virosa]|uniref:C2H2-type domain-containing protein n=1 Tax=Lactuca virosa TaxID=75947 RepID=A0AAU9MZG8_9ASTR|nr:unnamed protein product [Lactuca virosa]